MLFKGQLHLSYYLKNILKGLYVHMRNLNTQTHATLLETKIVVTLDCSYLGVVTKGGREVCYFLICVLVTWVC